MKDSRILTAAILLTGIGLMALGFPGENWESIL